MAPPSRPAAESIFSSLHRAARYVCTTEQAEDNSGKRIPRREDLRRTGGVPGRPPGSRAWSSTRRCTGALSTTPMPSGPRRPRRRLHWFKKWDNVQNHDFANAKVRWFEGGKLNVSYNCLDRHLEAGNGDKVAYYFEGDSPESTRHHHLQGSSGKRSPSSPTSSRRRASRRATGSSSTCP